MRSFIEDKLHKMMEQNHTRTDFAQKFQEIIDKYNVGGSSTENYYDDLMKFAKGMKEEDERHVREGLTEEELELYDTLKKDNLTKAEDQKVKLASKHPSVSAIFESFPILTATICMELMHQAGSNLPEKLDLIVRLLDEYPKVLVQDWWKDGQTQRIVKNAIEETLDKDLPKSYDRIVFKEKCENIYNLVVDFAVNDRKWVA